MATLARRGSQNPRVKELAHVLFQGDLESSLRSIFRYREENEEILRSPEFMVRDLDTIGYVEGDCDDISMLVAALAKSKGIPVRLTALQTTNPWEYDHVVPELYENGMWVPLDITISESTVYPAYAYDSEIV